MNRKEMGCALSAAFAAFGNVGSFAALGFWFLFFRYARVGKNES